MKFGHQFEFHKIPEWYNMYLDYELLKDFIDEFKADVSAGNAIKLPGLFTFTQANQSVIPLDFFTISRTGDHGARNGVSGSFDAS